MSSSNQGGRNWLLVEWKSGRRNIIFIRSVLSPLNKELRSGDVLTVKRRGEQETATLVACARDRDVLDKMIRELEREEEAGPSMKNEENFEDFSSSASSWVPSDDNGEQSEDSTVEVYHKKPKLETSKRQYCKTRSTKKIITPSRKATPRVQKRGKQPNIKSMMDRLNRKRIIQELSRDTFENQTLTGLPMKKDLQNGTRYVKIRVAALSMLSKCFEPVFKKLNELKRLQALVYHQSPPKEHVPFPLKVEDQSRTSYNQIVDEVREEVEETPENEDFNRSEDNVLITNKFNNVAVKTAPLQPLQPLQIKRAQKDEWVPIGSGKTLIHQDKFKRVNWKSYTIATRTLLLAVFPRRVLATHSLTGKKSPAFQNKPAKMCLDPKIISDVILEIMDRFNVRENLVRSIITTKCADECKMWKTRINKKKSQNRENIPPPRPSDNNLEEQKVM